MIDVTSEKEELEIGTHRAMELNSKLCKMTRHIEIGFSDDECVIAYRLDNLKKEFGESGAVILDVKIRPGLSDEIASLTAVMRLFRAIREMQENV